MGITFVKRSALPVPVIGKAPTNSVNISDKGQVTLSSLAAEPFGEDPKVYVAFEGTKAMIFASTSPVVAKAIKAGSLDEDSNYVMRRPKSIKGNKKSYQFSAAPLFRASKDFGASANYDFNKSGNQNFPCAWDVKNKMLTFTLPETGVLPARPSVPRKKKSKGANGAPGVNGGTKATPEAPTGSPIPPTTAEDIQLEA